jgi:hypothetical protein
MPGCFASFFVTEPVWLASRITPIGPDNGGLGREEARMAAVVWEKPVYSEVFLDPLKG